MHEANSSATQLALVQVTDPSALKSSETRKALDVRGKNQPITGSEALSAPVLAGPDILSAGAVHSIGRLLLG
jgi:hypothetical protein